MPPKPAARRPDEATSATRSRRSAGPDASARVPGDAGDPMYPVFECSARGPERRKPRPSDPARSDTLMAGYDRQP